MPNLIRDSALLQVALRGDYGLEIGIFPVCPLETTNYWRAKSDDACTAEQFPELVGTELRQMGLSVPEGVSAESATRMLSDLQSLLKRFAVLAPGEPMELQFGEAR